MFECTIIVATQGKRLFYSSAGLWETFVRLCAWFLNDGWEEVLSTLQQAKQLPALAITTYHRRRRCENAGEKQEYKRQEDTKRKRASTRTKGMARVAEASKSAESHGACVDGVSKKRRKTTTNSDPTARCNKCNKSIGKNAHKCGTFEVPRLRGGRRSQSTATGDESGVNTTLSLLRAAT